jgi:hypothetical protein
VDARLRGHDVYSWAAVRLFSNDGCLPHSSVDKLIFPQDGSRAMSHMLRQQRREACVAERDGVHIDIDLEFARYEYTRVIRIVPGGDTFAHPILTLGNRFAGSEDQLLSTYLHEQMHWYLWLLGTPQVDPIAPFYDELVRRYPHAPTSLPDGARNYEATYIHLVVNWLEIATLSEFIGRERAVALALAQTSYRWLYRTVVNDWDSLGALYADHGLVPITPAPQLIAQNAALSAAPRKTRAGSRPPASPRSRPRPRARGGKRAG